MTLITFFKCYVSNIYPEFEKDAVDFEVIGGFVVMQLRQILLRLMKEMV